jgi:hypothetical protein
VSRTPVRFGEMEAEREHARRLTDAQWLGLIANVPNVPCLWAMPRRDGDPVRVLVGGERLVVRVDADGTVYREPFEEAEDGSTRS